MVRSHVISKHNHARTRAHTRIVKRISKYGRRVRRDHLGHRVKGVFISRRFIERKGTKSFYLDRNAYYGSRKREFKSETADREISSGRERSWERERVRGRVERKIRSMAGLEHRYGSEDDDGKWFIGETFGSHAGVHNYVSFKACEGSYVFKQGKLFKVPATDKDALRSPLMGMFEKCAAREFLLIRARLWRGSGWRHIKDTI